MTQGSVEVDDGALTVADRIELLAARQDLAWERIGEREIRQARARGDEPAALCAQAANVLGIDGWIELADLTAAVYGAAV